MLKTWRGGQQKGRVHPNESHYQISLWELWNVFGARSILGSSGLNISACAALIWALLCLFTVIQSLVAGYCKGMNTLHCVLWWQDGADLRTFQRLKECDWTRFTKHTNESFFWKSMFRQSKSYRLHITHVCWSRWTDEVRATIKTHYSAWGLNHQPLNGCTVEVIFCLKFFTNELRPRHLMRWVSFTSTMCWKWTGMSKLTSSFSRPATKWLRTHTQQFTQLLWAETGREKKTFLITSFCSVLHEKQAKAK